MPPRPLVALALLASFSCAPPGMVPPGPSAGGAGGGGAGATAAWRVFSLNWTFAARATWGTSASDIWVVGDAGGIAHFDGAEWKTWPSLTTSFLRDVSGSAPDNVWTVGGWTGDNNVVVLRFDGQTWRAVTHSSFAVGLRAVWTSGPRDVWLGGDRQLLHFDGVSWTTHPSTAVIDDIAGASPSDVWFTRLGDTPLHWDGSRFTEATLPGPARGGEKLFVRASNEVWLAGTSGLLRWNGSSWALLSGPAPSPFIYEGVWASSANEVWLTMRFNDAGYWARYSGTTIETFTDLKKEPGGVIGFMGEPWFLTANSLTVGTGTGVVDLNVTQNLSGALALTPSSAWMVGDRGTLLRWDGSRVTPQPCPTRENLRAIWGSGSDDLWAVGARGVILHKDATGWSQAASPTQQDLTAVWGSARDDIWAIGPTGPFLHYDGQQWSTTPRAGAGNYQHLSGSGARDLYALGTRHLARWDGSAWHELEVGVRSDIAFGGLWVSDPNDAWLTEQTPFSGALWRWDGQRWVKWAGTSTRGGAPHPMWGTSASDVWASFGYGISHFDGQTWRDEGSPTKVVWLSGTSATDLWGVGPAGAVAHRAP